MNENEVKQKTPIESNPVSVVNYPSPTGGGLQVSTNEA